MLTLIDHCIRIIKRMLAPHDAFSCWPVEFCRVFCKQNFYNENRKNKKENTEEQNLFCNVATVSFFGIVFPFICLFIYTSCARCWVFVFFFFLFYFVASSKSMFYKLIRLCCFSHTRQQQQQ